MGSWRWWMCADVRGRSCVWKARVALSGAAHDRGTGEQHTREGNHRPAAASPCVVLLEEGSVDVADGHHWPLPRRAICRVVIRATCGTTPAASAVPKRVISFRADAFQVVHETTCNKFCTHTLSQVFS